MSIATEPFSMGSSSIALPAASDCMDMSLEDLIKARRNAITDQKKQSPLKSNTNANSQIKKNNRKVNAVQKSIGGNKAKRNAKTAARRGIASSGKPDPHAVEREVYRQQRRSGANGFGSNGGGDNAARTRSSGNPRRSTRIRSNKTEAERKMKAKNLANEKKKARQQKNNKNHNISRNNKNNNASKIQQLTAPPKKAVNAAMKAMNTAGFTAPKGMKMVISFEPSQKKVNNNNQRKQNNVGRRGQGGSNQRGKKH